MGRVSRRALQPMGGVCARARETKPGGRACVRAMPSSPNSLHSLHGLHSLHSLRRSRFATPKTCNDATNRRKSLSELQYRDLRNDAAEAGAEFDEVAGGDGTVAVVVESGICAAE